MLSGKAAFSARALANVAVSPPTNMSVLIIDPDTQTAERLAHALPRVRAVAVVPSWQAAVTALSARVPQVVVLDLDLPDAKGCDVIAYLHNTPAYRHVLIMVVTTHSSMSDKIAACKAGADNYLVKPITSEILAWHVQRMSLFRQVLSAS